ncbi:MAG: hypothetical protein Q9213_002854 [Squamulea squamosa]
MDSIDPSLRDHAQAASQPYPSLPPSNYSLNPIRLPPPQQQPTQQHHTPQHPHPHPWSQSEANLYYAQRAVQHGQQDNMHHDGPANQDDQSTPDSKRPRACEACRGLKVRCEPDPVKGNCRRCAKAGRPCVVTAPSRKRQKKTDSRVAELEKKIDALTASLHATKAQGMSESEDESVDDRAMADQLRLQGHRNLDYMTHENNRSANTPNMLPHHPSDAYSKRHERPSHQPALSSDRKRRMSQYLEEESAHTIQEPKPKPINADSPIRQSTRTMSGTSFVRPILQNGTLGTVPTTSHSHSSSPTHEYADVVDRKVLDATLAGELFDHYRQMAKHMPLVVFPPDTPAGTIRKHRPILFLAILSIASGQDHPDIQLILAKEIMRTFADRIVYRGEKSLELIQALQVLTIWYWPEENRDAQTYQLIHMAAVMAIDLGLGRRAKGSQEPYHAISKDQPKTKPSAQAWASEALESRRAWLGCYLLCANAAMGLRRTNLIRWSSHMDDCLEFLNTSSEALPSDSILAEWVRLQRLADDVGNQISGDESASLGISDVKTQYALKGFERQMKEWEKQASKQVASLSLTFNFYAANLYMHEFAMHLDQALEFPAPSHSQKLHDGRSRPEVLTTAHIGALTTCLTSIHGLFDTFLQSTTEDVRTVPVFYFVRIAYATVLLIKLYFAASAPDSELGKVISINDLRVEDYLRKLRELLQSGAGSGKCRPARSFFLVLVMLQTWFERQRDGKESLSEETDNNKRREAQPVDVERHGKSEYKRMQLNGGSPPTRRSSTTQVAPPTEGMDQSRLHVLGEVALGNSSSNGHTMNQMNENWTAYPPLAGTGGSGYVGYDYGTAVGPGPGPGPGPGAYDMAMHGYQPGLEQAIVMTFNEGNLSYMDDYALYNMMQMPNMFENMA